MTTRTRTDPRKNFVPRFLPWLLAVAAFAVYWFSLNRWVSRLQSEFGGLDFRLVLAAGSDRIRFCFSLRILSAGSRRRKFRWP